MSFVEHDITADQNYIVDSRAVFTNCLPPVFMQNCRHMYSLWLDLRLYNKLAISDQKTVEYSGISRNFERGQLDKKKKNRKSHNQLSESFLTNRNKFSQ